MLSALISTVHGYSALHLAASKIAFLASDSEIAQEALVKLGAA